MSNARPAAGGGVDGFHTRFWLQLRGAAADSNSLALAPTTVTVCFRARANSRRRRREGCRSLASHRLSIRRLLWGSCGIVTSRHARARACAWHCGVCQFAHGTFHACAAAAARARARTCWQTGRRAAQAGTPPGRQTGRQAGVGLFGVWFVGHPARSSDESGAPTNKSEARARACTLPGNRATEQRGNMCVCVFVRARVGACRVVGGQWSVVSGQ